MSQKHSSLVILGQGGVMISCISLLLSNILNNQSNNKVRIFDFGIILDLVEPEFYKSRPWIQELDSENIEQFNRVFKLKNNDVFTLMTPIDN